MLSICRHLGRTLTSRSLSFRALSTTLRLHHRYTPNFIAAIYGQLRCIKVGGVVYFVAPNRRGTYDHRRPATPVSRLTRRFEDRALTFSGEDASELLWGTTGHPHYEQKTSKKLAEIHSGGSGAHHFVEFTPASMLELLGYVTGQFNCELIYFSTFDPVHIHVWLSSFRLADHQETNATCDTATLREIGY